MTQTEQDLKLQLITGPHKTSLQKNRLKLLEYLVLSEKMWTIMRSNDSLTKSMVYEIQAKPTPDQQIGLLLDRLSQRHELAFKTFIRALVMTCQEQCANLVDCELTKIVMAEISKETDQPSDEATVATSTAVVQPSSVLETGFDLASRNPQGYPYRQAPQMPYPAYGQRAPLCSVPQQPPYIQGFGYSAYPLFPPQPQPGPDVSMNYQLSFTTPQCVPTRDLQNGHLPDGPAGDANGETNWRPQLPTGTGTGTGTAADGSKSSKANVDQNLAAESGLSTRSGPELTYARMQPQAAMNVLLQQTVAVLEENMVVTGSVEEQSTDETDAQAGQKPAGSLPQHMISVPSVIVSDLSDAEQIQHYLTAVDPETKEASMKETLQYVLQNRHLWENVGRRTTKAYEMNHSIHGRAIIINNEFFVDHSHYQRKGTNHDQDNLVQLLTLFGFETHVEKNKCKKDIVEILQRESALNHSQYDAFVLFILSHGTLGSVFGADSEQLAVDQIVEYFDSTHCSTLHGKPKIFFFQACQGGKDSKVQKDGGDAFVREKKPVVLPELDRHEQADMFIALSSVRGYASYRNELYGSYYVRSLVHVFVHYSHCQHLEEMLTTLNGLISKLTIEVKLDDYTTVGVKAIAQKTTSSTCSLYLCPKFD